MASGKKSALLSSLAAYGDDSEQDSDPDTDEQEAHGGLVSAGYGDDDAGRAEDGDERDSGNEESDENDRNSEVDDSDSAEPHEDSKLYSFPSLELRGPNLLQHDDAPVHKASSMKTWCVKVGVEELKCPAQSPDLNPTEHRLHPRPPRHPNISA
ncbi:hypothetical protein PDJAM_G00236930 [Pangasius djambal]|uniref:Uncharacterized protein n=1 Tax=Pangasius djambal TaxID=1691987 RepID=A0ACC5YGU9_9TELE|nr:hypothetical protein [Pangasius djambal]